MTADTMPLRTRLAIDVMPFARTSDWSINEKWEVIPYGEQYRTDNGTLEFTQLPGFQKYRMSYSCSGVRRPPMFDGIYIGALVNVTPIKEMEAFIPAGSLSVAVNKTPASSADFIVTDDLSGNVFNNGFDYSVVGNVVTLTTANSGLTTARYRWTSQFMIESLSSNWEERLSTEGWEFVIVEV